MAGLRHVSLILLLLFLSVSAEARWNGSQNLEKSTGLPASQWVTFKAYHIKESESELIWVNWKWWKGHGVQVPPQGMTPEFSAKLLDAIAYGVKGSGDSDELFDRGRAITAGADKYGGNGIGENLGSGRAITLETDVNGMPFVLQEKGAGQTPLIGNLRAEDHVSGKMDAVEALKEAIYSEINESDLPLGGNPVVAVYRRGTDFVIVREFPVRPAHFFAMPKRTPDPEYAEILERFLPGDNWIERFSRFTCNLADQLAASFARKIAHGALTPSNVEINGRWVDYGTESTLSGYGPMQMKAGLETAGSYSRTLRTVVDAFVNNAVYQLLATGTKDGDLKLGPLKERMEEVFRLRYYSTAYKEFLRLTGVPEKDLDSFFKSKEGQALGKTIMDVAIYEPIEPFVGKYSVPERSTKYDVGAILVALARAGTIESASVRANLSRFFKPEDSWLRDELAKEYAKFMRLAQKEAAKDGIPASNFWEFVRNSSYTRNVLKPAGYRWNIFARLKEALAIYKEKGNPDVLANVIDKTALAARRNYGSEGPYRGNLFSQEWGPDGSGYDYSYDAVTGRYLIRLRFSRIESGLSFFGKPVSISELTSDSAANVDGTPATASVSEKADGTVVELHLGRRLNPSEFWNIRVEFSRIHFTLNNLASSCEPLLAHARLTPL